jgi:hypothetical protein
MTESNSTMVVKEGFLKGYTRLPGFEQRELRDGLMEKTGWCISTFYHRCNGRIALKPLEIPVVEELFKQYNIDPWTGERLN